jgi:hypothetical protein
MYCNLLYYLEGLIYKLKTGFQSTVIVFTGGQPFEIPYNISEMAEA